MAENAENEQRRLLPWVIHALDENLYEGFRWKNKKKGIFQVPWSHKSATHWNPNCIEVAVAWAKYKGKDTGRDSKQLKSAFRCALNSKKELVPLTEQKNKRFRYWMILPKKLAETQVPESKRPKKRAKTKQSCLNQARKKKKAAETYSVMEPQQHSSTETFHCNSRDSNKHSETPVLPSFDSLRSSFPPSPPDENAARITVPQSSFSCTTGVINNCETPELSSFDSLWMNFPPSPPHEIRNTSALLPASPTKSVSDVQPFCDNNWKPCDIQDYFQVTSDSLYDFSAQHLKRNSVHTPPPESQANILLSLNSTADIYTALASDLMVSDGSFLSAYSFSDL